MSSPLDHREYDRSDLLTKGLRDLFGAWSRGACRVCGNPTDDHRKAYCSEKCRSIAYGAVGEYQWTAIRKRVLRRYGRACVSCGTTEDEGTDIEVDHITPISKGGPVHDERNLQPLCDECHKEKGLSTTDHRPEDRSPDVDPHTSTARERVLAYDEPLERETPEGFRVLSPERFVIEAGGEAPEERQDLRDRQHARETEMEEPDPPDRLPAYVVDPLDRQDQHALRSLQRYIAKRLDYLDWKARRPVTRAEVLDETDSNRDAETVSAVIETEGGTLQTKYIPCGPGCGGCPHGPYTYLYYRDYRGNLTSKYVGTGPAESYTPE